jgi:hypothetical protein
VLAAVAVGGFDSTTGVMSYHIAHDEYDGPANFSTPSSSPSPCSLQPGEPGDLPRCSAYMLALYRQHVASHAFSEFSAVFGRAQVANAAGYYVSCVSASGEDSGSVDQDGAVMLRFQKKAVKDIGACPR